MVSPMSLETYRHWESPAFVIAEAGVNHGGDLDTALHMVKLAARAGVDAIKFQTYTASRIAIRSSEAYWDRNFEAASSQFELFGRYDGLRRADYQKLAKECDGLGLMFLSTPFDVDCIDWLDELVPMFKVASADITNFPLLERVGRTKKPVLLSTGASTISEIEEAKLCLTNNGSPEVAILHCTLSYPTTADSANVAAIAHLQQSFPTCPIGYSVHTVPADSFVSIAAAFVLGARIIEKHFTYDKSLPGNDHYHAFDDEDFRRLRKELDQLQLLLGDRQKEVLPSEQAARIHARRSVVACETIPEGTRIAESMLDMKRPASGIAPRHLKDIVGLVASRSIREDEPLQWYMLRSAGDVGEL